VVPAGKCIGPDKRFFIKFTSLQCNQFSQPIVMWVWEWEEVAALLEWTLLIELTNSGKKQLNVDPR